MGTSTSDNTPLECSFSNVNSVNMSRKLVRCCFHLWSEFKDKFMEHFLCFQVLVSLKPKFSLLTSAAVLTDATDATVVLIQKLRTWQIK